MGLHKFIEDKHSILTIRPVAGRIGAEILDLGLRGDLDGETVAAIREAIFDHKVLFFRGQHHLTDGDLEAFGKLLGDLVPHPTLPKLDGAEMVLNVASDGTYSANHWHTDVTFVAAFPLASILHAVAVPSNAGETVWADTAAAYRNLPKILRDLADRLWVLHTNACDDAAARNGTPFAHRKYHNRLCASTVYETEHPLVQIHPETGERTLILGDFAQRIVGISQEDSSRLMAIFRDHITRFENTARWRWAPGDVAIWDNRATQHYGVGDCTEPSELLRITIDGDVPVGIDGRHSLARTRRINAPHLRVAAERINPGQRGSEPAYRRSPSTYTAS